MKNINKFLCLILSLLFIALLFGCGASPASSVSDESSEPVIYVYDGSIISDMLDRVIASSKTVESFPVLITGASLARQGCLIHYDKIEYNDNYVRGSTDPQKAYFLNEAALDEQVAISNAYLNCSKVTSPYLDDSFIEYINSNENGVYFTLYWLDSDVIFVSEIKAP